MSNSEGRLADAVGIFLTLSEWCPLRRRKPLPAGSDRRLPVRAPRGRMPRLGRSRVSPRFQGEHAAQAGSLGSAAWVDWLSGWRGGWGCGRDAGLGGGLIGGKGERYFDRQAAGRGGGGPTRWRRARKWSRASRG